MTVLEHRKGGRPAGRTSAAANGAAPPAEPTNSRGEYAHLDPLLARYAALSREDPRRRGLREELVGGFFPVVQHIARRYRDRGERRRIWSRWARSGFWERWSGSTPTAGPIS